MNDRDYHGLIWHGTENALAKSDFKLPAQVMDAGTAQVITTIASAVSTIIVAWLGFKIKKLEHSMNSIREELVQTTASKSHAEGVIAGKAEQKAETTLLSPRPGE